MVCKFPSNSNDYFILWFSIWKLSWNLCKLYFWGKVAPLEWRSHRALEVGLVEMPGDCLHLVMEIWVLLQLVLGYFGQYSCHIDQGWGDPYRSGLGWSLCCWCARSPAQGPPPSPGKRRRRKSRRLGGIEAILPHLWTSSVLLPWKAPWLLLLGKGIPFTGVTLFSYLSPQFDKTFCSRLWGPDVCDTQWYIAAGKNKCAVNWKTCLKKAQMGSTIASEVPLCESLM